MFVFKYLIIINYSKINLVMRICYVFNVFYDGDEWEVEEALLSILFFILLYNNQRLSKVFFANVCYFSIVCIVLKKNLVQMLSKNCLEFFFSHQVCCLVFFNYIQFELVNFGFIDKSSSSSRTQTLGFKFKPSWNIGV